MVETTTLVGPEPGFMPERLPERLSFSKDHEREKAEVEKIELVADEKGVARIP